MILSACAVGPDFAVPPAPPVAGYTPEGHPETTVSAAVASGAAQKFEIGRDIPGEWWRVFHSRELEGLVAEALQAKREQPLRRRLVQFLLDDRDALLYHNEPIYRDGEPIGFTTSGMFGHTLGAAVGMGYVNCSDGVSEEFIRSGAFELNVAGLRVSARASLAPLYDPGSERVRG